MKHLSAAHLPIPSVHQSGTPWLSRLGADEVVNVEGTTAQRWLWVQRGSLWVTAACGAAGSVGREADIWLSAGDSLELPPGTGWMLQAWPTADMVLLQRAPLHQAGAQAAGGTRQQPAPPWRGAAQRVMRWLTPGSHAGDRACPQRA